MSQSSSANRPSVLITGASTGIGAACALELDRRGFRVFAGVRNPADGNQLRQSASASLAPLRIDVTNPATIAAAAETIDDAVGAAAGLAGLVNNAGICIPGPLEFLPLEDLRRQLEVNVIGQVAVFQKMIPMLRRAGGRIVNISSVSGRIAPPYLGAYAASKHALEAISDSLRLELRRWGIRVAVVEPGSVQTPIWAKTRAWADETMERMDAALEPLYGDDIRVIQHMTEEASRTGMPVERVVRAVVHALTARRPGIRYPLGRETRLANLVRRFFPDRLRDWGLRRMMGLRKR